MKPIQNQEKNGSGSEKPSSSCRDRQFSLFDISMANSGRITQGMLYVCEERPGSRKDFRKECINSLELMLQSRMTRLQLLALVFKWQAL